MVVPGSHKRTDWKYEGQMRHGFFKPKILEDVTKSHVQMVNATPGDLVIFHDELLHGGSLNRAGTTRWSMEFTMILDAGLVARHGYTISLST